MDTVDEGSEERAADKIIRALETQIVSGTLADARPLPPERDLMEQFQASRTVVREAITALSNRGLVECRPRYRPIVRKPDYGTVLNATGDVIRHLLKNFDGVQNVFGSRAFIERALAREAAVSASLSDLERMEQALNANERAINNSEKFFETDIAFHGVMYDVPGNPIFPAIHEGFTSWLAPHWRRMPRDPARNLKNHHFHTAIFEAIKSRDPDGAERALTEHLDAAWEQVHHTFEFGED